MKLILFSSIFVAFFVGGECVECFRCFLGANNSYLYNNFPVSICLYNSSFDHKICETCMKLTIQNNGRESFIYDCYDRFIDNKLKNIVEIKNILACYSDFCNSEIDWKNHSLKTAALKTNFANSYSLPPYVFWGILGISFVIILVIQFIRSMYGFDEKNSEINI